MIISSTEFLRNYLWKYVDMTINKEEYDVIVSRFEYKNTKLYKLFETFKDIVKDDLDIRNYIFIIYCIDNDYIDRFLIFYMMNIRYMNLGETLLYSIDDVIEFVGEDRDRFKLLLISLYYFF